VATVRMAIAPEDALFLGAAFPQYTKINGTNMPVSGLAFDATTSELAHWQFPILSYGSGNLTLTIYWYADTASSGGVVWEATIRAVTPDADTQDVETDAYATATNVADTHLGTVGQRLHTCAVTISNLDALANLDLVTLRVARLPANASDTMTGDAILAAGILSYSDV
jgi:hypothetical protein